ncbi:NADH-quinone oxidoreductase subunit NuoE [Enterovirga sp.]|uniref:NADH-quinone oxidoreductase subunit NuoE n=1 Tax=Enterovirga sp. TaxID=2026350 RepID=UPI0026111D52|nr:NADH-quinone oxidoreductase subunit NuoE [Enterovirga sp.]MDB5590924.1 NADH-quinone oxidoreductase, subunit [Enterovirga sp.]
MSVRRLARAEIQPATFAFTEENERWLAAQVAKYPDGRQASAVIPALWQAQKQHDGWLPKPAIEAVAARLGMPIIRVMEVATFYTMFNLEPVGRWFIQLCGTVPCHVKGALDLKQVLLEKVGDQQHVTPDGNFSWLEVECLGACCNAPMVQINDDYYEDLTPDLLIGLLADLAEGRTVKPGPQNGRRSSEPLDAVKTLQDPALFDGSLVGGWRKRFDAAASAVPADGARDASGPGDPKAAKPDAGRAIERPVADAPAQRAQNGEAPIKPAEQAQASDPGKTSVVDPAPPAPAQPPQSSKSYVATPSKPEDGRVAAGSLGTTPISGAPGQGGPGRRDGSDTKPVGADPNASPGVAPKEGR